MIRYLTWPQAEIPAVASEAQAFPVPGGVWIEYAPLHEIVSDFASDKATAVFVSVDGSAQSVYLGRYRLFTADENGAWAVIPDFPEVLEGDPPVLKRMPQASPRLYQADGSYSGFAIDRFVKGLEISDGKREVTVYSDWAYLQEEQWGGSSVIYPLAVFDLDPEEGIPNSLNFRDCGARELEVGPYEWEPEPLRELPASPISLVTVSGASWPLAGIPKFVQAAVCLAGLDEDF